MKLRPYQERSVPALRAQYAAGHRAVLYVLPTGGGKSTVAAEVVRLAARRAPAVFFAHRKELIDQIVATFARAGLTEPRVIRAGRDDGPRDARITVASIDTVSGEGWIDRLPEAGLVVVDEAHHAKARTWEAMLRRYVSARILGLTATPQRHDGAPLGDIFTAMVVGATVRELTDQGHLVPCRVWAPPTVLEPGKLALTPLEAYRRHANGRLAIVFCTEVADAERFAEELTAGGVPAGVVHGELGARRRADVLARFRAGKLRAVVNVGVLTEGTDIPEASACIMSRRPQHAGLLLQCAGRVLRPAPWTDKRDAVLVDLCGSVLIHGTPDMDRTYSLDGRGISSPERLSIRQCPACGGVFEAARAASGRCPACGAAFPVLPRKQPRAIDVALADVTDPIQLADARLRTNLANAARATGRSRDWVERAARKIGGVA